MTTQSIFYLIFIALSGLVIGSFLNVCIYRIPNKEDMVFSRSHCMNCGHTLSWYELVPVFSYLIQRGRCRHCEEKITIQYPMIELMNAIGYVWIFLHLGFYMRSILYCLLQSVLIVIGMIDERTMEIPIGCNYFIAGLGLVRVVSDLSHWYHYLIGVVCVSGVLLCIYIITRGKGIGGGDVKLMAASGLLLGGAQIVLGFLIGCVAASVIHLIRMKVSKASKVLAFGPYLCAGIWIAAVYGNEIISWYLAKY